MNSLNIQRQADRRDEILSAAQRCFVRSGFHQTSMQEICTEAGMSAGNLYRYFPSKEAIIAGIAERDRAEVAQDFARADLSHVTLGPVLATSTLALAWRPRLDNVRPALVPVRRRIIEVLRRALARAS